MTSNHFVGLFAIAPRRRIVATAIVYGLSLAVRFTSATGEEVEIPPQSMQGSHPLISIMATDRTALPYQEWAPGSVQPIVFRQGWPTSPTSTTSPPNCLAR